MWSLTGIKPVHGDSLSLIHFFTIFMGHGITLYTLIELPVFTPNEYFWKNHWDGKEEKWQLFARTVRKIMADVGGYEVSDSTLEHKLEYKNLIRGKKSVPKQTPIKID
jgi:hypothetical protein